MIIGAEEVGSREQRKGIRDEDQNGPTIAEARTWNSRRTSGYLK